MVKNKTQPKTQHFHALICSKANPRLVVALKKQCPKILIMILVSLLRINGVKLSRFKLKPKSLSSATVHISSGKNGNSVSANKFWILGLPQTESTGQAVMGPFCSRSCGLVFVVVVVPHSFPR